MTLKSLGPWSQFSRLNAAIRLCEESTGVNPLTLYCSITGAPIGEFDRDTFNGVMAEVFEYMDPQQDAEEITDDLMLRTLSSMRPSPVWNYSDRQSLNKRMKSRPAETLSYLLIRLYEPSSQLKLEHDRRLGLYHRRILIHRLCKWVVETKLNWQEWIYLLIEIDALYNLTSLSIPGNDILSTLGEIRYAAEGENGPEQFESFLDGWRAWHKKLYDEYEKKQRAALRQDQWLKGNPAAGPARLTLFMEVKPKSEAQVKKAAKNEADNEMTNLLRAIMEQTHGQKPMDTPAPIQTPGFIKGFGKLKLNIAGASK